MMKVILSVIIFVGILPNLHSQEKFSEKIDQLIEGYTMTGRFNGTVLVASNNQILIQKGYGFSNFSDSTLNDTCTIFQIASVTKQFTSALILKLVELNRLELTDNLNKFYPDFPRGESISVENLLTHTSGIFDWTNSINFFPHDEESFIGFLKTKAFDFPPGTGWRYSNSNYSLLGYIIQKASGMTYENAIRKYIFDPLQMTHSGFDFKNLKSKDKATGYSVFTNYSKKEGVVYDSVGPFAAGAIYSTVGDLYKWHKGLQSNKIINRTSLEKACTDLKNNYGYGWIVDSLFNRRVTSHSGNISGFCSNLARITEDNVIIIILNNKEGSGLESITKNIFAVLYDGPYSIPVKRQPVTLSEEILTKYIGNYEIASPEGTMDREVRIKQGKLLLQSEDGPYLELIAEKEDCFYNTMDDNEYDVEFIKGTNGRIAEIILCRNGVKLSGRKIR